MTYNELYDVLSDNGIDNFSYILEQYYPHVQDDKLNELLKEYQNVEIVAEKAEDALWRYLNQKSREEDEGQTN